MSSALIDSSLLIKLELTNTIEINNRFGKRAENLGSLATDFLLYDEVIIPTHDFGIVPILIDWLGLEIFLEAIESGSISFLHRLGLLGYAGNGNGVGTFIVAPGKGAKFEWWEKALFGSKEVALEAQLENRCIYLTPVERNKIIDKISAKTRLIEYENEFFIKNIANESYLDILGSNDLKKAIIKLSNTKRESSIDLTRLVKPDELKTQTADGLIFDSPGLVLEIAEINFQICMSTQVHCADILVSKGSELVLKNKLIRAGINKTYIDGFYSLLELTNMPNIGRAISNGVFDISVIWDLRRKPRSRDFRRWLKNANTKDARELEKMYVASLDNKSLIETLPIKTVRFILTNACSSIEPIIGTGISAIDSFFVEKWLKGFSPKLFMDGLRCLPIKNV